MTALLLTYLVLLSVLVAVQGVALAWLIRMFAVAYGKGIGRSAYGPGVGDPAPALGPSRMLGAGSSDAMIFFLGSTCGPCSRLRSEIGDFAKAHHEEVSVFANVSGPDSASISDFVAELGPHVIAGHDLGGHLQSDWSIPITPFVVALVEGTVVAKSDRTSHVDLEKMLWEAKKWRDEFSDRGTHGARRGSHT